MLNVLEMQAFFREAEWTFFQNPSYYNWQTYYFRVCQYYNEMVSDARYIGVKDIVKILQSAVSFLKNNIPLECYGPYHDEVETLERIAYFLNRHLEEIKLPRKSLFSN